MVQTEDLITLETEQAVDAGRAKAKPAPKDKNLIQTWLSEFEEKNAREFRRRTGLDYKSTVALIIDTADPFPGMQVLDIPTGTGVIARQFVGKVGDKGRIVGVDLTREKLETARLAAQSSKVSMHVELKPMSLERLSFERDSFDLITSFMAFHRLKGEKLLAEAYRVLRPRGRLLIADELAPETGASPFRLSVRRNYFKYIRRDESEANAHFRTTEEMMQMLSDIGFSQIMFRGLRQRSKHDRVFTLIKAVK
ncbi:MAG: methyltransferase domain-containing protein [Acidobacteriota bacterium]|nr:MAG: methyltransferase domain-containing protein [Acidobacteriota bacterium]